MKEVNSLSKYLTNMTEKKAKILFVEDDVYLSFVTRDNLEIAGYEIILTDNGREAFDLFSENKVDICILDVMLVEMDGFTLARKIREVNKEVPILFLTAKSMKEDKIAGLKLGADDYITKPFSIEELIFKIEVFLKRSKISYTKVVEQSVISFNSFILDFDNLTLKNEKDRVRLTPKEAELLRYMILNKNNILKKEQILKEIWGNDDYYLSRSLDVFISRLRKYLKPDAAVSIENIHGVGFRLNCME
ncbi:MAG: response regulator transcription factor [Bacteroidota bacterium]